MNRLLKIHQGTGNICPLRMSARSFLSILICPIGSGPRCQILSHVFAGCASQKTHGHARIARETQPAKSATQIIYLGPLPSAQVSHVGPASVHILSKSATKRQIFLQSLPSGGWRYAGRQYRELWCVRMTQQQKVVHQA